MTKSFSKVIFFVLIIILVFSFSANGASKKVRLGVSFMNLSNPFFVGIRESIVKSAKTAGVEIVEFDSQFDAAKQLSGVENFIAQKVDGILLNPVDSNAIVPAVMSANSSKIPIVTMDTTASDGNIQCYVSSDNIAAGRVGAEYIVKRLNGKGKICVIDYPIIQVGLERIEGLYQVFKKYPNIQIIAQQKGGSTTDALKLGEVWVQQFDKIDAVWGINDQNAIGALTACEQANKNDTFVVGVDGIPEAYDAMKEGRNFGATAAQQPDQIGKIAFDTMMKVIKGGKVPKEIKVPVKLVTQADIKAGK